MNTTGRPYVRWFVIRFSILSIHAAHLARSVTFGSITIRYTSMVLDHCAILRLISRRIRADMGHTDADGSLRTDLSYTDEGDVEYPLAILSDGSAVSIRPNGPNAPKYHPH